MGSIEALQHGQAAPHLHLVDQQRALRVLGAAAASPSPIRTFFDANGNLLPVQDLDTEQGACLASVEVLIKNAKDGDGRTDEVHELKLWDKTRAINPPCALTTSTK